jgi:UDP-glucose 4-epimerase
MSVKSKETIVVTGASGFFGRHLAAFLSARGYNLVLLSRREIALPRNTRAVKINDIADVDWARHLDGASAVVHLAGLAHVTSFIPESDYRRTNVAATQRVADAAKECGAKFVLISSVAAQSGPSSETVLAETDPPIPTNAYGRSKLAAEEEVRAAGGKYVIFRPTLTYGPGVSGNMGKLIALALRGIPPPLGLLTNLRSILAMENMCHAVSFALENPRAIGEVFLLADRHPISVADMVKCLRLGAGYSIGALPVPPALLAQALRWTGRYELWDKLSGDLVVSVDKLRDYGFSWQVETREALRLLGKGYAADRKAA